MRNSIVFVLAVFSFAVIGCGKDTAEPKPADNNAASSGGHDGHDHHHDHDHSAAGPHGGHVMEIGDEQYHAEWTHDDKSGKITIYLLDGDIKEDAWTTAESITITTKIRDDEQEHALLAVNQDEQEPPQASQFEITSPNLLTALNQVGPAVTAELKVTIGGESFRVEFEKHAHDH